MLILATDMARHSEIVENFKGKLDTFDFNNDEYLKSVSIKTSFMLTDSVIIRLISSL